MTTGQPASRRNVSTVGRVARGHKLKRGPVFPGHIELSSHLETGALSFYDLFGVRPRKEAILRKKFKPGIFEGITHKQYHSLPYCSSSYLERLRECPAKAKIPRTDTPQMAFGRAVHCYVLEGEQAFRDGFVVLDHDLNMRTKAGKEEYAKVQGENPGKEIVVFDDFKKIEEIWGVLSAHPYASRLLMQGKSEQSVFWTDPETLIDCKARPDRVPAGDHGVIIDLKTTRDSEQWSFERDCLKLGYYRKAAMYVEGFNLVSSTQVDAFVFIVCETTPPYPVEVYALPSWRLEQGRMEYHALLEIERSCRQANHWPAWRYSSIRTLYEEC